MLDPSAIVALEMAPRLVAGQFREPPRIPARPGRSFPKNLVRNRAARVLRTIAAALESTPARRTAG